MLIFTDTPFRSLAGWAGSFPWYRPPRRPKDLKGTGKLEGGDLVAVLFEAGDQLLDVVRPPEFDLQGHLDVVQAGVQNPLPAVLDADNVDPHPSDRPRKALELAGAVPQAGPEGEVPAGRRHAEADDPHEEQRVDVAPGDDDDGGEGDGGAAPHCPGDADGRGGLD